MIIRMVSLFLLAVFSSTTYAFSENPYPDGKVQLKIEKNQLCAYINKLNLKGYYVIEVFSNDGNTIESSNYKNKFDSYYPLESKCLYLNNQNFKGLNLSSNRKYSISLIPDKHLNAAENIKYNFNGLVTDFCLNNQNGQLKIQDYIQGQCIDKEPKAPKAQASTTDTGSKSWFERLLGWFKGL